MPISHRPLTPPEMLNCERLLDGINGISEAVCRWNDLARTLCIPPIAVRFAGAPQRLAGDLEASAVVSELITDNHIRQAVAFERKAA